jgi:hypothetical protein
MTASLTLLRCGLGRDSLAMLCLLVERRLVVEGQPLLPEALDAVVFSDTGAEWRTTYALIPRVRAVCSSHGLRFIAQMKPSQEVWQPFLTQRQIGQRGGQPWRETEPATIEEKAARGWYHNRAPIMADYGSKGTIVALADPSCTHNHKVLPNRQLIEDLSRERFGVGNRAWSAAVSKGERPPHRILLGIAADEAHRAIDEAGPLYERNLYPLVEMGIRKADEAPILERHGLAQVHKSGCVMCKFQPLSWYWALSVVEPDQFAEVVAYEARALVRNPKLLIFPRSGLPLSAAVTAWRKENPSATVEAVMAKDYKRCERAMATDLQLGLFERAA